MFAGGGKEKVDESYLVGRRKGKHRRGFGEKPLYFIELKAITMVNAKAIVNAKEATLVPIIKENIPQYGIVYNNSLQGYKDIRI